VRFALFDLPDNQSPVEEQRLWLTVAHELSHFIQPKLSDHLLLEGGAEYLALSVLLGQGMADDNFALSYLKAAINDCLLLADSRTFEQVAGSGGRLPYSCGLAVHFLLHLTSASTDDGATWLKGIYRDSSVFGVWPQIFGSESRWASWKERPVSGFIDEVRASVAVDATDVDGDGPDSPREAALKRQLFTRLMQFACGGRHSFYDRNGTFVIAPLPRGCDSLSEGQVVTSIARERLSRPAAAIWTAVQESCVAARSVRVGLNDGSELSIACDGFPRLPRLVHSLHPDLLKRLLGRSSEPSYPPPRETRVQTTK
jgi:hypothetical protein